MIGNVHVGGLKALLALFDVEGNFVAFVEVTETGTLDGGEVNEDVGLTVALFDEAELRVYAVHASFASDTHGAPGSMMDG